MRAVSLLFISTIVLEMGLCFIAYDCSSSRLNITAFSTLEVKPCNIEDLSKPTAISYGKLIQRKENILLLYYSCFVLISYLVTRCSTFSDMQAVQDGVFDRLDIQGADRCRSMHNTRTYNPGTPYMVTPLESNSTLRVDRTLAGEVHPDGRCSGAYFSVGGRSWTNVVVQAKLLIVLSDGLMVGSTKDNKVIHPSGARYNMKDGYGIKQTAGDIVWDAHRLTECETGEYDVLYSGPMSKVRYMTPGTQGSFRDIFIVKNEDSLFALKVDKQTIACNYPAFSTEHPRLYIVTDGYAASRFTSTNIDPINMDMTVST